MPGAAEKKADILAASTDHRPIQGVSEDSDKICIAKNSACII